VSVRELFDRVSERVLAERAEVEKARMFASDGLKTGGKFFAMVSSKGDLVVKLPAERVDEIVSSGAGERFDPGHGRVMKEWASLRPADEQACAAYVEEAREFVAAQAR
jgi:TfoX/Sxy family transcriptional regulator of competence genes